MWAVGAGGASPEAVAAAASAGLDGVCMMSSLDDLGAHVKRAQDAGLAVRCSSIGPWDGGGPGDERLAAAIASGASGTTIDWPFRACELHCPTRLRRQSAH